MHLCCIALAWSHPTGLWPSCPGKSAPIICIWWFIDLLVLESHESLEDMSVSFVPSPVSAPQRQRACSKGTEGCPVRSNDGGWIVRWWLNRPRMPNVKTSHPCCPNPSPPPPPIELAHPPSSYNSDFVTVSAFLFLCFWPWVLWAAPQTLVCKEPF